MNPRLAGILAQKRKEVEDLKEKGVSTKMDEDVPPVRDFRGALFGEDRITVIAEIKFASPSAGILLKDGDPVQIARIYEGAGAGAVSLLTDRRFFHGDIRYLPRVRRAISLPVLRKDFIMDPIQVEESIRFGADAILLIAGILSRNRLKELLTMARGSGMACLTEVHNRDELESAIACGADIIGINNRDLTTFAVDIHTTLDLAPLIPDGCIRVSESGVSNHEEIRRLRQSNIHAVLVGTSLMKARDMGAKTRELADAGRGNGTG
ncbi:MAG: indole-3-glycerol phosphate synthase TrpC [Deltaproteobacteria bacterium]|nr:indole-3-glycerol phosphate synthase TrpC [Deltaproteobacteria bacterium]